MEKVIVNMKINDYTLKTEGYLNNNILGFVDNDKERTNIIYDYNTDTLIRDNKEIMIKLFFKKDFQNIEYFLKYNKCKFNHEMKELLLIKSSNKYIISYRIEGQNYNLTLSYERE